jgi:GAF domain-containing protein
MLASIRSLFNPPTLEDPEQTIQARNLFTILLATMILAALYLLYSLLVPPITQAIAPLVVIVFGFGMLILLRIERLGIASVAFTTLLWLAVLSEVVLYGGIRDTGYAAFVIVVVVAGLTMGVRGGIVYTLMSILAGIVLTFAEQNGLLPPYVQTTSTSVLLSYTITFTSVTLLLYLAIHSVTTASRSALAGEHAQEEANRLLTQSQTDLEQRTASLEQRNAALQTLADIARLVGQARNESELLEQSSRIIATKIGAEHVAIYLLDETEDNAIMIASSSPEGKSLLAKGYKLNVIRSEFAFVLRGTELLHYFVADRNYYLEKPQQLQGLGSNLSFPMTSSEHLVGLLNLQTVAVDPQVIDRQTMQTIADQIALSIANLRLLAQLHGRIQEIDSLAGQAVTGAWSSLRGGESFGYDYDRLQVMPAVEDLPPEIASELLAGRSTSYLSSEAAPRARLVAPILLRENVIGVIGYEDNDPAHEWQLDEKALLETVASRVSLALENTRLVAEAQQRAERERVIGQVTARMRETLDLETILKTAVREIRQSLDLNEAEVRLQLTDQVRKPGKERSQ